MSVLDPPFRIELDRAAGATIVRPVGELDVASSDELRRTLAGITRPPDLVVLDCSELRFIDSTGLRVLLTAHRHGLQEGYRFVVAAASGPVRSMLRLTALELTLVLAEDVAAAMA